MNWFLLQCHAFISSKTAKYLQNVRFSRKLHQDLPIDGSKTSNLRRPIELDKFYRMDWFLLQCDAFISPKTAKYLENVRFSRKLHQDSPIDGSKTSNLRRPIELDELVRMVMTWFGLNDWIPFEKANPCRSADFVFSWRRCVFFFFWKTWKLQWQGHFLKNILLQRKLVKNVFCIYLSVYVARLLSVREEGSTDIIHFIIWSLLQVFRNFVGYASMQQLK